MVHSTPVLDTRMMLVPQVHLPVNPLSVFLAGGENFVALDLIVQHVHSQLEKVKIPQLVSVLQLVKWLFPLRMALIKCLHFL